LVECDVRLRDPARLEALRRTGLLDSAAEDIYQRLTVAARRLLAAPVALVSLVDADRQFFASASGLPEPWASTRQTPLSHSFCQHVVLRGCPLVVEDARQHPTLQHNLAVPDFDVVAYLGVPLITPDGQILGSFCVIDHVPRRWGPREVATMEALAGAVMTEIALRILGSDLEREIADRAHRLGETTERLRLALTITRVGSFDLDLLADTLVPCALTCAILGCTPDEPLPLTGLRDRIHPSDRGAVLRAVQAATAPEGGAELQLEARIARAGGGWRWVRARALLQRDAAGRLTGGVGAVLDITDQRALEENLRRSQRFIQSVNDAAPVGIYAFVPETEAIHYVNQRFVEMMGHRPDARPWAHALDDLVAPEGRHTLREHLAAVSEAAEGTVAEIEVNIRRRDGASRWMLHRHTRLPRGQGEPPLILGVALDITARREQQEAAVEAAALERVRGDVAQLLAASGPADPVDAMLGRVSACLTDRLGVPGARVWLLEGSGARLVAGWGIGGGPTDAAPFALQDTLLGAVAATQRHQTREVSSDEPELGAVVRAAGALRLFATAAPLAVGEQLLGVVALFSEAALSNAVRNTFDGIAVLLAQTIARKAAEGALRLVQEELEARVAERTASLEQSVRSMEELLYAIAHDLRAPNRAIRGYAEILADDHAAHLDAEALGFLHRIASVAVRNDALILDLLELGRISHADVPLGPIDLEGPFEAALATVEEQVRSSGARLDVHLEHRWAVGNAALLERALVNLLANALKYTRPACNPVVTLTARLENGHVLISVRDEGIGIPEEQQRRVFDPFIRLPGGAARPGTGIGLALVRKSAERMHARFGVESVLGQGSSFWLELPAADAP